MGSCYGPKRIFDDKNEMYSDRYEPNNIYIDTCCLSVGNYTLQCINKIGPYGWGRSFLEMQGQRYCDDFVGYEVLRRIVVGGKYSISIS